MDDIVGKFTASPTKPVNYAPAPAAAAPAAITAATPAALAAAAGKPTGTSQTHTEPASVIQM